MMAAFHGFPLEKAIADAATRAGIALSPAAVASLALHAGAVVAHNERLHLTTIVEPREFVERHIEESLRGAALIEHDATGVLLDLGSGNGYPGLPVALARPGLRVVLAEASAKKAAFLRDVLTGGGFAGATVLEAQVQRAPDVAALGAIRVVTSRAMGGWAKVLPRMHAAFTPDGAVILWAGDDVETVRTREAWKRFRLETKVPLPGRESSWIWRFRLVTKAA